ncbi:MAG TPA: winged helix-turn-helix domain-containing protein [Mycobacteriales bacterium]|jgi:hypothetical protein|nr:winged helix-turn-helix domain-containing protein [Mycobacteriales bacterium]
MLVLSLDVKDLASVRFGYSPIQETVQSMWALRNPERHPVHRKWRDKALPRLDEFDWPLLNALIGPGGWVPDFLTPYPETNVPRFDDEIATLGHTEPERVRRDIHASNIGRDRRPRSLPKVLRGADHDPAGLRDAIADALASYWQILIAPHWPRLCDVLDGDIDYRSRILATAGAAELFDSLGSPLTWHDGRLELDARGLDAEAAVDGRGLMLTPSLFANSVNSMIDERLPPVLCYPARGRAELWSTSRPAGSDLAALLGATRAALLSGLDAPATTTQLALRLNLTPGGVSQHLKILHNSGLLRRTRTGRAVFYKRSEIADQLVLAAGRSAQPESPSP